MACFAIGEKRTEKLPRDRGERIIGEYSLHIQCPWRVVDGDKILTASFDIYKPEAGNEEDDPDFDWEKGNLFDKRMKDLFRNGDRELRIEAVEAGCGGALRMQLEDDLWLEIFPNDSLPDEHWRLFAPSSDHHFVVTGAGIDE